MKLAEGKLLLGPWGAAGSSRRLAGEHGRAPLSGMLLFMSRALLCLWVPPAIPGALSSLSEGGEGLPPSLFASPLPVVYSPGGGGNSACK